MRQQTSEHCTRDLKGDVILHNFCSDADLHPAGQMQHILDIMLHHGCINRKWVVYLSEQSCMVKTARKGQGHRTRSSSSINPTKCQSLAIINLCVVGI